MKGKITFLPANKRYGFLVDEHGTQRFFEAGAISPSSPVAFEELEQGDRVQFEPIVHPKGERAVNLSLAAKEGEFVPSTSDD
jgi:cold shock CspA family protein